MSERSLQDVKVGDLVGAVKTDDFGRKNKWTGVIHKVTKVTAKRFMIGSRWMEKATGREMGRGCGNYTYILATPDMVAASEAKEKVQQEEAAKRNAFHARPDYQAASAIRYLLEEINPDYHDVLDRLKPEEWAELLRRLQA